MIPLDQAVEDYLAMRRALGYQLTEHGRVLPQFAAFLEQRDESLITTTLALEFATLPAQASVVWWHQRLAIVRGFARYLHAFDACHEVPPVNLLPAKFRRAMPYLFSDAEIEALLEAARSLRPPLRAASCEALIGLLAVSGMRVSEACGLDRSDVELAEGRLTVRHAKNGRSREIPLHASTVEALTRYARARDELCPVPKDPAAFFLSGAGGRVRRHFAWKWFDQLRHATGLDQETLGRRARLHDVRHSYVLRTLVGWYRDGGDIEARLPLLSTVLGHVRPADTFWYFEGAPELLALACERLERTWDEPSSDGASDAPAPLPLSWERSRRSRPHQMRRGKGRR
ncbi:MAG: tyrosine-type recombinase/integrase [Actinomycetota bacterium]|nr:tyrosine-type recombinase/integrase [Actinomycetota bacterium]